MLGGLRAALLEAVPQFIQAGGHDENIDQRVADERIRALANGVRALHIDIDEHIRAFPQGVDDALAERAVGVVVHSGVFEEIARGDPSFEVDGVHEMVVLAIGFPGAGCPRGAGDGVDRIRRLPERTANGRLSGAGWRGDDEENAEAFQRKS